MFLENKDNLLIEHIYLFRDASLNKLLGYNFKNGVTFIPSTESSEVVLKNIFSIYSSK